jgi:hypothetical protein
MRCSKLAVPGAVAGSAAYPLSTNREKFTTGAA